MEYFLIFTVCTMYKDELRLIRDRAILLGVVPS